MDGSNPSPRPERPRAGRCPICGDVRDTRYRPFCSRRCADIDLGRWLEGAYHIPGEPDDEVGDSLFEPGPDDDE